MRSVLRPILQDQYPIDGFSHCSGSLMCEIDDYLNRTDVLKILDVQDGSKLGVTCLISALLTDRKKFRNIQSIKLIVELIVSNLSNATCKVSEWLLFEECLLYEFIHLHSSGKGSIAGIVLVFGAEYDRLIGELPKRKIPINSFKRYEQYELLKHLQYQKGTFPSVWESSPPNELTLPRVEVSTLIFDSNSN